MSNSPFAGTLFDLSGKVTLLTGSSKGMGAAVARRLAQHGSKVVVSSRNQADCDAYAAKLNEEFGEGTAFACA